MPKWLRIAMYSVAGAIGLGGALLGYSKALTMLAGIAAMLGIEAANYLMHRRDNQDA